MSARNQKAMLANMLAEVKFAEKQVTKIETKLPAVEARIKQALRAGDRDLAKKYALAYEEQKLELKRAQERVALAKKQYAAGKEKAKAVGSAQATAKLNQAMSGLADSLDVLNRDDDMLQKIEEQNALTEARLELALEDAERKNPELMLDLPPAATTAEDILKEFES